MKYIRYLILLGVLLAAVILYSATITENHTQSSAYDRFLEVEAWHGNFKVEFQRSIDMSIPPNLINIHNERSQSSGHMRLDATDQASSQWGRYMTWTGQGETAAAYFNVSEAKTPAFTGSGVTEGQASIPGEAALTIDPVRGQYEVIFRTNSPLTVVERSWSELNPELERIAAAAKSGDLEAFLFGFPALLAEQSIPSSALAERQVNAPTGSSDRQPLPSSGLVLSGIREYQGTKFSWSLRPDVSFLANAGGPYEIVRGETLQLDGSQSMGDIVDYEWTFVPGTGYPSDAPFNTGALKTGEKPQAVFLCDVKVTLTVRGANGQEDQDQTQVVVIPRDWTTGSGHKNKEGDMSPDMGYYEIYAWRDDDGWNSPKHTGAVNVSIKDDRVEPGKLFDPVRGENNSWAGEGYDIIQVHDPNGPFDDLHYSENYRIKLIRRTLINPNLKEDSRIPFRTNTGQFSNWYDFNVEMHNKAEADAYLESIRIHEREHTRLMEESIRGESDPARSVEEMFHSNLDVLQDKIDRKICEAERKACLDMLKLHDNPPEGDKKSYTLWFPRKVGGFVQVTVPPYSITQAERQKENALCER